MDEQRPPSRLAGFLQSTWGPFILLAVISFSTVIGCIGDPFIDLDDGIYVTENPLLKPDQPWSRLFTEHAYYQRIPLTMVSYRLNAALFGLDAAWSFRLVNWILHAAAALLLLKVLERLGLSRLAALAIALLWAAHPMACESVAWVSQRRNVLGFFFGVLAFYLYVRWYDSILGFLLPPLAFLLALFSSPLTLGWLPVFVALEVLGGPRRLAHVEAPGRFRPAVHATLGLVPLILLSALVLWMGVSGYARTMRPPPGGSVVTALLTDTGLFFQYVQNALMPVHLSAMYGVDAIESFADAWLWVNLALWSMLIGGTLWFAGSRRRAIFGWLWFFGGLGPACNIVAVGYPMQDRYLYLSLAGLLLVLVETLAGLAQRVKLREGSPLRLAVPLACLVFLTLLASHRSTLWSDSVRLMEDAVEAQPEAALSHIFYARQLGSVADDTWHQGRRDEAREVNRLAAQHLEQGLSKPDAYLFNPLYAEILLAGNLVDAGEPHRAIELLEDRLPAPDAPKQNFGNGPPCFTFVASRFQFTYTLSMEAVNRGYVHLARAYLHTLLERPIPPEEARPILKHAVSCSVNALKVVPGSPEAQCLRACLLLAEESFVRKDIPAEKALAEACARARLTEPELRILSRIPGVKEDLKKQVSLARIHALGCLGMARSCFEPLLTQPFPPEAIRQRFDDAVQWSHRAGQHDPTLGATFLYLARIQHFLYEVARSGGDEALMAKQRQACIDALLKVPAASACYPKAQQNLKALGVDVGPDHPVNFK